jgi:DNA replication protein DnaC
MKRQSVNLRREFAFNPARFLATAVPRPTIVVHAPETETARPYPLADELRKLSLYGMAETLDRLRGARPRSLPRFEDWLSALVAGEAASRKQKRVASRLRAAGLRYRAPLADVDYNASRGFDDALFHLLAAGRWLEDGDNVIIDGPAGVGKTWLACALGEKACSDDHSVRYERVPRLSAELDAVRSTTRYTRRIRTLQHVDLLIIDDWGIEPFTAEQRHDLLEILEGRYDRGSTLVVSPIAVEHWPRVIGDPTVASEILDRVIHNAHRLQLRGESLRDPQKTSPRGAAAA